ncbi:MAG TPA: chemotaxis-specific protein-glutamate methyltransferase CheB [Acetobacteraceae bacterium]|nr:chemotaxis-specific protein-glutamate methyltransferase CheB [Acetobacteraceae bacterium]
MLPRPRIRLLIVDDSAVVRRLLRGAFEAEPDFEVEIARDGAEALERAARFRPDVMTLDVAMPGMDGLACLRALPARHGCAVVMVSSLTARGAQVTLEALSLGAVDFIAKPSAAQGGTLDAIRAELVAKVRLASQARRPAVVSATPAPVPRIPVSPTRQAEPGLVVIGASTGGPRALERILPALPAAFPWPVVVAQHMPPMFTGVLAQRLDAQCALRVVEAAGTCPLHPGSVTIAAGNQDLTVARGPDALMARPVPTDRSPWHPSVDRLMRSARDCLPPARLVGVLLTGMGNDGAAEMAALHGEGGRTIAEAEESAVVFGMPADLIRRGGATAILPPERVAARLVEWCAAPAAARVS